ncbi:MAG: Lrp/AsnC family transcriptional regulator [Emcibacteraceae bacterium]|nr:Lrp/AsnC family transcriptional regulator [Emcibacteraceae bacterium]
MDEKDKNLINLLRENSRASTTTLARTLGLSRSTVQDRIKRLEDRGVIAGYTIRFNDEYRQRQISAQVMMTFHPQYSATILNSLKKMPSVVSIFAVSGIYDLITTVRAETTEELDETIDNIGILPGMEKTTTSIILSKKYEM